jgi:hypothetical protein
MTVVVVVAILMVMIVIVVRGGATHLQVSEALGRQWAQALP